MYCKFGTGSTTSMGSARIKFPINHITLSITMHVTKDNVPLILLLAYINILRIKCENLENTVVSEGSAMTA